MNTELLWQFDFTWALADLHLAALVELDVDHVRTALWLNAELMKNVAEIGQLRLLRAAGA
jgi:hypothetical protein